MGRKLPPPWERCPSKLSMSIIVTDETCLQTLIGWLGSTDRETMFASLSCPRKLHRAGQRSRLLPLERNESVQTMTRKMNHFPIRSVLERNRPPKLFFRLSYAVRSAHLAHRISGSLWTPGFVRCHRCSIRITTLSYTNISCSEIYIVQLTDTAFPWLFCKRFTRRSSDSGREARAT
jgi:hypothetical protein